MKVLSTLVAGLLGVAAALPLAFGLVGGEEARGPTELAMATGEAIETPKIDTSSPTPTPTGQREVEAEDPAPEPPPSSPTAIAAPHVDCAGDTTPVANAGLGIAFCIPSGWGPWTGGSERASLAEANERTTIHVFSEEWFPFPVDAYERPLSSAEAERLSKGIRISVSYAPEYMTFEGCTPQEPSPFPTLPKFCEDIYTITPKAVAEFRRDGDTTAWKFLTPVDARHIDGFERKGGYLFVLVQFPSNERARAMSQTMAVLSSVAIR